jgi:hypothetical protein
MFLKTELIVFYFMDQCCRQAVFVPKNLCHNLHDQILSFQTPLDFTLNKKLSSYQNF